MKKSILLLLFAGLLMACTGNDDTVSGRLNGRWTMTAYVAPGTTAPVLNDGDITWSINGDEIGVTNNVYSQFPETLPTGMYEALVDPNEGSIFIENGDNDLYYSYTLNNGELMLTQHSGAGDNDPTLIFN